MAGLSSGVSGGRRLWLFELDLGHVHRFSTEIVAVSSLTGAVYRYEDGLTDPGVALELAAGRDEVTETVEVVTGEDWAEIVARGVPIAGRTATLLRHEKDTIYERAKVVLRGTVIGLSHGGAGEPAKFTIRRALAEVTATLPPPQAVIDTTTWFITPAHLIPEDSLGACYPIVIGSPGYNGTGTPFPAMQVYYAQFHPGDEATCYIPVCDGVCAATTVYMVVQDEQAEAQGLTPILTPRTTRSVAQITDNLGRTLSYTTVDGGAGLIQAVEEVRIFVGFSQSGGGGVKDRRQTPLRGAGTVLRWVLGEHMDYRVDWPRFEALYDRLNAYQIDTFLNEATNLWSWLQEEVLPVLPIELRESVDGLYPFWWNWQATRRDAVQFLDASLITGNVARTSEISCGASDIYNEITLQYGPHSDGSAWFHRKIATSTARETAKQSSPNDDVRIRGSSLLGDSQRVFGLRQLTLQFAAVWDHATAELVLRDRIAQHAWPRRKVSYEGSGRLEELSSGDVVTITDPELHLSSEVALVWDVTPSGEAVSVDLVLIDHPRQTFRQTS